VCPLTIRWLMTFLGLMFFSWGVLADLDSGYEQAKKISGLCSDPGVKDQMPDAWRFAACNCTSYVAYRLNLNGVKDFNNQYGGVPKWSDAHYWDDSDRAGRANVLVDQYPAVGSVAHWNAGEGGASIYGHVAYVYKINVHGDGSLSSIEVAEYNKANDGLYGIRTLTPGTSGYPGRFLHFEEKVNGDKPNATCVTNAQNLPGGYGPFCWIHGQYSSVCEHATKWYYFDQANNKFYTLSASSCPPQATGGAGSGYTTYVSEDASRYTVESGLESPGALPITGGTNSGTLPNLIPNNSDIENASKVKVTTLHINEPGYCRMQIKNIGNADADAFQTRCYISDGSKIDNNPRDEGKEDTNGLDKGDTHTEHEDFIAPEYPGTYNAVFCVDSGKQVTESNEGDNCHDEDTFTVWSNPNVLATEVSITGGRTTLQPGELYTADAVVANIGENFGKDIRVGWYLSGAEYGNGARVLVDSDRIKRENLKGGTTKVESLSARAAPTILGNYLLEACPDYENRIAETNESDNCKGWAFEVVDPNPPTSSPPPAPPGPDDYRHANPAIIQLLLGL
jgi:surface antigen